MKKVIFFFLIGLLAFTMSANAQRVLLRVNRPYEVAIDGRRYTGNAISYLPYGYHRIDVYSTSGGFIFKRRSLINSSSFNMGNGDVTITVDSYGQLRVYDNSYGRNNRYDNGYGPYNNNPGRGYGPYNNPGRGHKYGLYKNKNRKDRDYDDDDRYERNRRDD